MSYCGQSYYNSSCYSPCYQYCCPVTVTYPLTLRARLNGLNEVPPVTTAATGILTGSLVKISGVTIFAFALTAQNLVNVVAAHFHDGTAGVNGPVVRNITVDANGIGTGIWRSDDMVDPLTPALESKLLSGGIYVNVHTQTNTGGEIRGQVYSDN